MERKENSFCIMKPCLTKKIYRVTSMGIGPQSRIKVFAIIDSVSRLK